MYFASKIYHKMQAFCKTLWVFSIPTRLKSVSRTPKVSHIGHRLNLLIGEVECDNSLISNFHYRSLTECSFGEAVSQLTKSSLMSRSPVNKALSVRRLVSDAVFNRLPKPDIIFYLDFSITFLSDGFPNTLDKTGHHQGHG